MEKGELLHKINEYFANTSKEHLQKVYEELKDFNQCGPTVDEYLEVIKPSLDTNELDRLNKINSDGVEMPMLQLAQ